MGQLRDRMKADLELRRYAAPTQEEYLRCAERFAGHYMRPPLELGETEVRCFILHLIHVQDATAPTLKMYVAALKFLYKTTLRRPAVVALGKRAFYQQVERDLSGAYELAGRTMACNLVMDDAAEGIDAFLARRPPAWGPARGV